MAPRVAAVVVTWNRRALLERLLGALDGGTVRPDVVVVVDNASTDGTLEWLARRSGDVPVVVHPLAENTGGAGGFNAGIRRAWNEGADLLWLMDDDGFPEPDCLATLLTRAGTLDFWGPVVVAEHARQLLAFPIRVPGTARILRSVDDVTRAATRGLLPDVVVPFNGVLVTAELVERIGLPRAEFFIWGDDVEYLWRARRLGARTGTLASARFRHPATDTLGSPTLFGRSTYNHSDSDLKHYCLVRNNVTNLREYRGAAAVMAFLLKTVWFYSVTRPSPTRLRLSASAVVAATRGRFDGHRRWLR